MKARRFLLIGCFLLALSFASCQDGDTMTGVSESADSSSQPSSEEAGADSVSESRPEREPEPVSQGPVVTEAWKRATEGLASIEEADIVCAFSTRANNPALEDTLSHRYPLENVVVLGDPDAPDAQYYSFAVKYEGTEVRVTSLLGEAGNEYSGIVENGRIVFLLSGFYDYQQSPPAYSRPYRIAFHAGEATAELYPTPYQTYHTDMRNAASYVDFIDQPAELSLGNEPVETEEKADDGKAGWKLGDQYPTFSATDYSYVCCWGDTYSDGFWRLGNAMSEKSVNRLREFVLEYHREQGYGPRYTVCYSYTDKAGNVDIVIGNGLNQELYIVRMAAEDGEPSLLRTISTDYAADNTLMPLPFAEGSYLSVGSHNLSDCRLIRGGGGAAKEDDPSGEGRISWIMNPIVNPHNPGEQLYVGCLTQSYIVLLRRDNEIIGWYTTRTLERNSSYLNAYTTGSVIAGVSIDEFVTPMPYKSSFGDEIVRVAFPESYVTYTFDFRALGIEARVEYDESFRAGMYNTFVYSTSDGRYELWKMNERWFHEGSTYGYAIYDTLAGRVIDFYDDVPDLYYTVNLYDDHTAAVLSTTYGSDNQRHSQIRLYDLQTMTSTRVLLPVDQVLSEREQRLYLRSYAWDPYRRRHIILATENYGNFHVYTFSPDGSLLDSQRTEIYQFGGKFVLYPEQLQVIGDGLLYLRDNLGRRGGVLYRMDTGEAQENYIHLPVERTVIRRLIGDALSGAEKKDPYGSGQPGYELEAYLNSLPRDETGEQLYEAILAGVPQDSSAPLYRYPGTRILYSKLSGMLYSPSSDEDNTFFIRQPAVSYGASIPELELWSPDGEAAFLIGIGRNPQGKSSSLFALALTGSGILGEPVAVSRITYPLNMSRMPSQSEILRVPDDRFTDMGLETNGNVLTLSYHNTEWDRRIPFAQAVYRNGEFELLPYQGQEG